LAKWVGMPDDAPLLDIAVEVSSALETPRCVYEDHHNHV
jgi:hypothetical protein